MTFSKIIETDKKRFSRTLEFLSRHLNKEMKILDLGTENNLSKIMQKEGYDIRNTEGEDLDTDFQKYVDTDVDVITSFEIFEHMFAPFNILNNLKTKKLVASIPLKLWFTSAHWDNDKDWNCHYHEFEKKQFDLLLKRTGWKIEDSETWTSATWKHIGIRPLLRHFTPRYYIVYCTRVK